MHRKTESGSGKAVADAFPVFVIQRRDILEHPLLCYAFLCYTIAGLEDGTVGKARAPGVPDLLHEYVDDIHEAIDGHTHEDTAK